MTINKHNYESFMIDYLEGNLSDDLRLAMEVFLSENPDIAEEAEGLSDIALDIETADYESKDKLKQFAQLLDASSDTFAQWEKTMPSLPKENVVYPHKEALKQKSKTVVLYRWSLAAAACLTLVLVSLLLFDKPGAEEVQTLADKSTDSQIEAVDFTPVEIKSIEKTELAAIEIKPSKAETVKQKTTQQTDDLIAKQEVAEEEETLNRAAANIQGLTVITPEFNHLNMAVIYPQSTITPISNEQEEDSGLFPWNENLESTIKSEISRSSNIASSRFLDGVNAIFHRLGRTYYKTKSDLQNSNLANFLAQAEK